MGRPNTQIELNCNISFVHLRLERKNGVKGVKASCQHWQKKEKVCQESWEVLESRDLQNHQCSQYPPCLPVRQAEKWHSPPSSGKPQRVSCCKRRGKCSICKNKRGNVAWTHNINGIQWIHWRHSINIYIYHWRIYRYPLKFLVALTALKKTDIFLKRVCWWLVILVGVFQSPNLQLGQIAPPAHCLRINGCWMVGSEDVFCKLEQVRRKNHEKSTIYIWFVYAFPSKSSISIVDFPFLIQPLPPGVDRQASMDLRGLKLSLRSWESQGASSSGLEVD